MESKPGVTMNSEHLKGLWAFMVVSLVSLNIEVPLM